MLDHGQVVGDKEVGKAHLIGIILMVNRTYDTRKLRLIIDMVSLW
jgi:hypothetical protein